jgi:peroxiredoxin/outer membrane lipoprotein-sorting protein
MISVALVVACLVLQDGQPQSQPEEPAAADKATILKRACAALRGLETLSFDVRKSSTRSLRSEYGVDPDRSGAQELSATVLMARGGRCRVDVSQGEKPLGMVICDGHETTEWNAGKQQWTRYPVAAPAAGESFQALLFKPPEWQSQYFTSWIGQDAAQVQWFEQLAKEDQVKAAPLHPVDGRSCHTIRFEEETRDAAMELNMRETLALYFDAQTNLLVRYEQNILATGAHELEDKRSIVYAHLNTRTNPELKPDAFVFTPPPGATEVDSAPLRAERARKRGTFGADPRAQAQGRPGGQPAPDFELPGLDGKTVALREFKDKQAVLVAFWATWCVPCRKEMTTLTKLHEEFGGQGLKVIGISTDTGVDLVQKLLKKQPLPYLILHDADGAAKTAYEVESLPKTVLIGKDGVIIRTWFGWSGAEEEAAIRENLKQLGIPAP